MSFVFDDLAVGGQQTVWGWYAYLTWSWCCKD